MLLEKHLRRRRFRFSLRTLFILVTIAAVWTSYSLNWIKQRRALMDDLKSKPWHIVKGETIAPGLLWVFGERGYAEIGVNGNDDEVSEAARLFPEADVGIVRY